MKRTQLYFLYLKLKKGVILLDYCIKNYKNVYIKLNGNGQPVTCGESFKGLFAEHKAKNILNSLPKTLRKMNFRIVAIPDIKPKKDEKEETKVIQNDTYAISEDISRWVNKFGACSDILEEARQREDELISALDSVDKEFLNILHSIELEKSKDMYGGWQQYRYIKENRERRRKYKDELLIIQNVLKKINPNCLRREQVQKAVNGLLGRKYAFRIVEEEGDDNGIL